MLAIAFLFEFSKGFWLLAVVPESITLLVSGVGLVGATMILRRVFKRRDEKTEEKI